MPEYASSHSIIKDLKGISDPPTSGGPSKISIARQTWKSDSIYFPNKDEVLVEWILNSLSRQKGNHDQGSAIYSHAYWSLLSDILAERSSPERIWLPTLLNRVSISNIVSSFFKDVPKDSIINDIPLVESFAICLTYLWPISASRMNLDSLTDCFCSVLSFISSFPSLQQCHEPILESCLLVTRSLRQSLGTATNKKRASLAIGGENLPQWVKIAASPFGNGSERRAENALRIEIYQIGIDVIFSLETLKSANDPIIAILQRGFTTGTPVSQISLIPRIFRSYLDEMRRYRYGVFGSGSSQSQEQTVQNKVRDVGLGAFSMCYKSIRDYGDKVEVWKSVLELLEVIDEGKIVGVRSETMDVFSEIALWSAKALSVPVVPQERATYEFRVEKVNTAIGILRVLLRIDQEIIGPLLRDILSGLLMISPSIFPDSNMLLREFLEFFSKTRDVMGYVSALMEAMSQTNLMSTFAGHVDLQAVHRSSILGSLLSIEHFEDLGRAVRGFLTPGQAQQCVNCVLGALRDAYANEYPDETPMDVDESSQQKLQRENCQQEVAEIDFAANISAISFSLLARTSAIILPCLPFNNLPPAVLTGIKTSIDVFGDEIMSKIIRTRLEASEIWRNQLIVTSTLRIRHSLVTSVSLQSARICQERCILKTLNIKPQKAILPELIVETLRAFFDWDFSYSGNDDQCGTIDFLMKYLTDNLTSTENSNEIVDDTVTTSWDGLSGTLDFSKTGGHHRAALSIWHLTLDRWLPLIDELASPSQLRMLSELILSLLSSDEHMNTTGFTARLVLERTMRNAMFWELTNIRESLLLNAEKVMPVGSLDDFSKLANEIRGKSKKSRTHWERRQVMTVASVYELLLLAPKEYLSKTQRSSFVQRGLVADMAMYLSAKLDDNKQVYLQPRMMVRTWLGIASDTVDILALAHDWAFYFEFLLQANLYEGNEAFEAASSNLIGNAMRETLRDALRGNDLKLTRLCPLLQEFKGGNSQYECNVLQFVSTLISEVPSNERHRLRSVNAIELIHGSMEAQNPTKTSVRNRASHSFRTQILAIKTWRSYLALHKWLEKTSSIQRCGRELIASFVMCSDHEVKSLELSELYSEVLLLLVDELYFTANDERKSHLELLVATYILLGRLDNSDMSVCDVDLGRVSMTLPHSDFKLLLDLITDALRNGLNSPKEIQCAIHLSQVLASNAPEGSSKIVQDHFEDCLQIFNNGNLLGCGEPVTEFEALSLVRSQCTERPASIRSLSLGIVWLILSKCLTGSSSHTPHTHRRILTMIVDIVGVLIRLRRDLVQATLPHLVMILRLLLSSLRSIRPQLGAKQTQLVSDTLPWWINTSEPMGIDEARAVGRLLTSLQTKTIPRTFKEKDKTEAQRAESLTHPFSKHASYVLLAYLEAMNHPLCVLPLAIRRELEPGLFALCDMMSEHGRDALMASALDAGGKATLKVLWREYEKQRYVGKG